MGGNLTMEMAVAGVYAAAMVLRGGLLVLVAHAWFGLQFLPKNWFNPDAV